MARRRRGSARQQLKLGSGVAAAAAQWRRLAQWRCQLGDGAAAGATARRLQLGCSVAVVAWVVALSATAAAAWRLRDGSGGSVVVRPAN